MNYNNDLVLPIENIDGDEHAYGCVVELKHNNNKRKKGVYANINGKYQTKTRGISRPSRVVIFPNESHFGFGHRLRGGEEE